MAERITPYALVFGPPVFETDWFPRIAHEAQSRAVDPADETQFVMLGTVGQLLRALRPEPDADAERADAVTWYGQLVFHAFHFWREDRRVHALPESHLRALLDAREPVGDWSFATPFPAGYLQLPLNLCWTVTEPGTPPEPIDGAFWMASEHRLRLLLCTGVRPGRAGFGAIGLAAPLPAPAPGHWGDAQAREDGADFANILPGGELNRLLGIVNAAEVLKLVSRVFHDAAVHTAGAGT